MTDDRIIEFLATLARDAEARQHTARELACYLNADDLLILIHNKPHSIYLPAYGFPQTLPGGRSWRAFISEVLAHTSAISEIGYPATTNKRRAQGWAAADGSILTLFDGHPKLEGVRQVVRTLPLIAPTFEKERATIITSAQAKLSAQAAQHARQLAESLDAVRRQLQSTVILRERDITERVRIEAELERSNAELRRVNDDLNQFTFAATHDVQEPLRMITIYVQLLQDELRADVPEAAHAYMDRVVSASQRISRLIDGLLQFTRMGQAQSVQSGAVDVQAALKEALADLQLTLAESQAELISEELPPVIADQLHIRQLFQNLIGNAIKYRRPNVTPKVRISAQREDAYWLFSVRDNGIGIAPEHFEHVFVPFKRLHGPEISGAGIGLATCKRIVERYGGRIWVDSVEDGGSVFYFLLAAVEEAKNAIS